MNSSQLSELGYSEFFLWIIGKRKRFRVTGISMQPLLQPGEEILLDPKAYEKKVPQINDLVVAIHPEKPGLEIVKRVSHISKEGKVFLLGDNLAYSSDSRNFGLIPLQSIIGKVTSKFG